MHRHSPFCKVKNLSLSITFHMFSYLHYNIICSENEKDDFSRLFLVRSCGGFIVSIHAPCTGTITHSCTAMVLSVHVVPISHSALSGLDNGPHKPWKVQSLMLNSHQNFPTISVSLFLQKCKQHWIRKEILWEMDRILWSLQSPHFYDRQHLRWRFHVWVWAPYNPSQCCLQCEVDFVRVWFDGELDECTLQSNSNKRFP